jgi:hypothetical protein
MNKTAPPLGGGAASVDKERSKPFNNLPHRSAQHPSKPHVRRAAAPPLSACPSASGDTVTTIFEAVALHLRTTIPALSSLTLDDFDAALADLHPQIRELIDAEIREEVEEELIMREMERESVLLEETYKRGS